MRHSGQIAANSDRIVQAQFTRFATATHFIVKCRFQAETRSQAARHRIRRDLLGTPRMRSARNPDRTLPIHRA
jgi:hypothetical protein